MASYTVKVVQRDGTVVRTLQDANVERIVHELNAPGEVVFTYPKHDPSGASGQGADVLLLQREVQVFRDSTIVFWGVPVQRRAASGDGAMAVTAPGVGWYFGRRFVDAQAQNLLTNPSFESGTTGWTANNVTASTTTSTFRRGAQAVQLVGSSTYGENYLTQTIDDHTGTAVGTLLTLAGWFYISSWTGPAFESRGLFIELLNSAGTVVQTYNSLDGVIDDSTPRNSWQRLEATTWIPPNLTYDIRVRLYAPNGTIVWDALSLTRQESLAIATTEDIATTANRIVNHLQDSTKGKSALSIATTTPPTSGVNFVFPRAWQYADHTPADRALNDEIVPLGVDWSVEITSTTKTFTVHAPRKGTNRSASVTLSPTTNVASYELDEEGGSVETQVTYLGDGDGPDREEGWATDTSSLGGLILEGRHSAPPGTTIDKLDGLASDHLARSKRIVKLLGVTTYQGATDLVSLLKTGDVVAVNINDGNVQVSGNYRIVRIEHTPRNETLALTLNEE